MHLCFGTRYRRSLQRISSKSELSVSGQRTSIVLLLFKNFFPAENRAAGRHQVEESIPRAEVWSKAKPAERQTLAAWRRQILG